MSFLFINVQKLVLKEILFVFHDLLITVSHRDLEVIQMRLLIEELF